MMPLARSVAHVLAALLVVGASACSGDDKGTTGDATSTSASSAATTSDGGSSSSGGSTSASASSSSGSGSDASTAAGSSTSAGGDIDCSVKPQVFPDFDKSCVTAEDCVIVLHTDCCGPLALGLNKGEADAFADAEAICGPQCPPLGCNHPTIAEDGGMALQDSDVQVHCDGGACMTFVP
ncbi:MAG: hypothetical protein H6711_04090 [Myxococcales bacterium]|nr:hypothetical protein [Myxococcales bacterium]